MTRNRRKPRVVIPTNVDQLIATAMRVAAAIGTSIIASMTNVADLRNRILNAAENARNSTDAAIRSNEMSQNYVRMRDEVFDRLRDVLIQIRDYAHATDGRTSPGMLGFEVVQSTSSSGRPTVVMPNNPDQFLALAGRVNQSVINSGDPNLILMAAGMTEEIELATTRQTMAIQLREQWQLQLDQRRTSEAQLTVLMREVRDLGFAAAGPYRYEAVSTTGLIVQASATQGDGNGQPIENWTGGEFTGGDDDTNAAVNNIVARFGNGPFLTSEVLEAFGNRSIEFELAESSEATRNSTFTKDRLLEVASQAPFSTGNSHEQNQAGGESQGGVRLLADVAVAFSNLAGVSILDQSFRNDERLVTLDEALAIFSDEFGTTDFVEQAFNSVSEPPRVALLDDVVEAFLECQRESARVATANGTPTEETRTVEEVIQQVLAENPEASRDQFFESDWLASTVARTAPNTNVGGFLAGTVDPDGVRRTFIGGVNTGCAFTAYDIALATTMQLADGEITFFEFPPQINDQVLGTIRNGTHQLSDGSVVVLEDGVVVEFTADPSTLAPQSSLNVFDLAAQFRLCLLSSGNDGLPDEQTIGTADEIAEGIAQSAGILEDLIDEQEFLGNLPFGEAAAPCGVFAWLTVRQGISNSDTETDQEISAPIETFTETIGGIVDREVTPESLGFEPGQAVTLQQLRDAVANAGVDDLAEGFAFEAWNIHFELETVSTDDIFEDLGFTGLDEYEGVNVTLEQLTAILSENEIAFNEEEVASAFQESL